MPIFVEWKWIEKTQTLLAIFHFWDDGQKENLRMRVKEYDFETLVFADYDKKYFASNEEFTSIITAPEYGLAYPRTNAYMSWAPSHAEFCLLTEVLTYANLINGLKPYLRRKVKEKLQGRITRYNKDGKILTDISIHSELLIAMPDKAIVSFAHQL
jgi:hypothetical protein